MSAGDKAFDDVHSFGNGRAQACEGIDELLFGIHNGPFDGSIVLGENIRDAFGSKSAKCGAHWGLHSSCIEHLSAFRTW